MKEGEAESSRVSEGIRCVQVGQCFFYQPWKTQNFETDNGTQISKESLVGQIITQIVTRLLEMRGRSIFLALEKFLRMGTKFLGFC